MIDIESAILQSTSSRTIITVTSLLVSFIISVAAPIAYALVRYSDETHRLALIAELNAADLATAATPVITPSGQRVDKRLIGALAVLSPDAKTIRRRITDSMGVLAADRGERAAWPSVGRTAPLRVAGAELGTLHVEMSLRSLLAEFGIVALVCAFLGLGAHFGIRVVSLRLVDRLLGEQKAQNLRFNTAIDNMSQGLCFFDGTQRLIVCNDRYADMYRLSRDLVRPGTRLAEIVDHRYKAGSFPEMTRAEYLAARDSVVIADKATDTVIGLKDGRTFAIHHQPMPDGGWVATHEDITHRKIAEMALRVSEERFRSLVNLSSDWYWEQDAELRFTWSSNEQIEKAAHRSRGLLGMRRWELPDLSPLSGSWEEHKATVAARRPYRDFECLRVGDDGVARYLSVSGQPVLDEQGNFQGYRGTGRDITLHKRVESLHHLEHTVTRCLSDADNVTQALTGVIRAVCEAERWPCGEYWGVDETSNVLRFGGLWDRLDAETRQIFAQAHKFEFAPGVGLAGRIWQTGEPIWIADVSEDPQMLRKELAREAGLRGALLFPCVAEGKVVGVFAFWSQSTRAPDELPLQAIRVIGSQVGQYLRRKQTEERIQYLATHDELTGLPNRVMFRELLCSEIASAQRYERKFAVLFIDLDRFKFVNDTLGHQAGDLLLKEMAGRLKAVLRASDVVARLSGDEFVVLLREVNDPGQVTSVARKILSAAMKPVESVTKECRVTASIGIAMYPLDAQDEPSLMKNADMAMYLAKEEGKNNYQFYSADMRSQSIEKLALETQLRGALGRNELFLHYQAKLDLKTETITGVEALLRWNNPELGSVSPAQVIPIAEETGLIVPIGKWVLRTACAQNVSWQRQGLPPVCIAVNLSPRQFADPDLVTDIAAVLQETGMAPELLELEITESMVMHNTDRAVTLLSAIKELGVRLAIDDFGTGYSSLAQLKRFPIDTLKVDRSFIREIATNPEDKAITEAIIALGRTLGLTVVAEGVETEAQQSFLREQACDEIQGYYFSRPIAPEEFATFLEGHSCAHPSCVT